MKSIDKKDVKSPIVKKEAAKDASKSTTAPKTGATDGKGDKSAVKPKTDSKAKPSTPTTSSKPGDDKAKTTSKIPTKTSGNLPIDMAVGL